MLTQIMIVRVFNSCDCEIFREDCSSPEEIKNVVSALLDNIEDGDKITFEAEIK